METLKNSVNPNEVINAINNNAENAAKIVNNKRNAEKNKPANKPKKEKLSDKDKLIADIMKIDKSELSNKTTGKKSLYNADAIKQFARGKKDERGSKGRHAIRNEQYKLSVSLLSAIQTKIDLPKHKKNLLDFYKLVLKDFNVFADERKDKEKFDKISKAHNYLKLVK